MLLVVGKIVIIGFDCVVKGIFLLLLVNWLRLVIVVGCSGSWEIFLIFLWFLLLGLLVLVVVIWVGVIFCVSGVFFLWMFLFVMVLLFSGNVLILLLEIFVVLLVILLMDFMVFKLVDNFLLFMFFNGLFLGDSNVVDLFILVFVEIKLIDFLVVIFNSFLVILSLFFLLWCRLEMLLLWCFDFVGVLCCYVVSNIGKVVFLCIMKVLL